MAKRVEQTATPAKAPNKGEGETQAPQPGTTGAQSAGRDHIGTVDNAAPAPLPLCDLKSALSPSSRLGRLCSLNWRSTRADASCCHPPLSASNSKSSCGSGGLAPRTRADHDGGSKPSTPINSLAAATAAEKYGVSPPASKWLTKTLL